MDDDDDCYDNGWPSAFDDTRDRTGLQDQRLQVHAFHRSIHNKHI